MKIYFYKELAKGKWFQLSLAEQMANIGSEVSRARKWQKKDKELFRSAIERALELFDLTMEDLRWRSRLKEIARIRTIFCDAISGGKEYKSSLEELEPYFLAFTHLANISK